jgi:protein-tyrosine phosphatase
VIDLHSHLLPGIDDGVRTLDDAVALARQSVADGVKTIAATPHVRDDYPTTPGMLVAGVARVRDALAEAGVELEVVSGAEVDLARLSMLSDEALVAFSYGGLGRHVLIEFPERGWPMSIDAAVDAVRAAGMTAVLAHPERNPQVGERPELVETLVDRGALVQVTALSLEGRFGRSPLQAVRALLGLRLVHVLASDAHGTGERGPRLSAAAALVEDEGLRRYLTEDAPAAILAGSSPEPQRRPPRRRWFR